MRIATLLLCVTVLGACGEDSDRRDEEITDLIHATTGLIRKTDAEVHERPMIEKIDTDDGTVVFAIWSNGAHEVWKVGADGTVITLAYRNKSGSLVRTANSVRETTIR